VTVHAGRRPVSTRSAPRSSTAAPCASATVCASRRTSRSCSSRATRCW
jgi:hypothetical protein